MTKEELNKLMNISKPLKGFKRKYVACKECLMPMSYDYQPYSLSNPIRTLGCGHCIGQRFDVSVKSCTEDEFYSYWNQVHEERK